MVDPIPYIPQLLLPAPPTLNRDAGAVVPIPTLPLELIRSRSTLDVLSIILNEPEVFLESRSQVRPPEEAFCNLIASSPLEVYKFNFTPGLAVPIPTLPIK